MYVNYLGTHDLITHLEIVAHALVGHVAVDNSPNPKGLHAPGNPEAHAAKPQDAEGPARHLRSKQPHGLPQAPLPGLHSFHSC